MLNILGVRSLPALQANAFYTSHEEVVACDLDDGRALLDLRKSKYYKLNNTGALVWEWLEEGATIDTLAEKMMEQFSVEDAQCRADINGILSSFLDAGLIEQSGAKAS